MPTTTKTDSRLLAIGDIHGYEDELILLLREASYDPLKDRLMLLGDYIDADKPATWSTLGTIRQLVAQGARAILGNHEVRLLAWLKAHKRSKLVHQEWLQQLPYYCVEDQFLFVHAGIRPGIPLTKQSTRDLTEIRDDFIRKPLSDRDEAKRYTIIFGHTPTFKLGAAPGTIWQGERRLAIDTGAKHGYRLTLLDVTGLLSYSCSTAPSSRRSNLQITPISLS